MSRRYPAPEDAEAENLREFEEFYRQHFKAISRYVTRRLPSSSHDEVIAAAFVVAWKKFATVERPSLPWLYRIASFEVTNERRRLGRVPPIVELADVNICDQFGLEDVIDVSRAFGSLNDHDQELLRLVYWEELGRAEIAQVVGCSINTLNVRIHRALERLRGSIAREELFTLKPSRQDIPSEEE